MATQQDKEPKDYVDRGVQTLACSSTLWLTRQPKPSLAKTSNLLSESLYGATLESFADVLSDRCDSPESNSFAFSHALPPNSPSLIRPVARRTVDRQLTPYKHPKPHFKKRRILSLPIDAITEERTSIELPDNTKLRIVSLPTRLAKSSSPDSSSSSEASFSTYQQPEPCHLPPRLLLRRYDETPHTPSPPSSPESVLIIENENQLPKSFLRQKITNNDDGGEHYSQLTSGVYNILAGWITWAHSPPRPIPALHGPLSLPYARCPS